MSDLELQTRTELEENHRHASGYASFEAVAMRVKELSDKVDRMESESARLNRRLDAMLEKAEELFDMVQREGLGALMRRRRPKKEKTSGARAE